MEIQVNIFPNMDEDKIVDFTVSVTSGAESLKDQFGVHINGNVPLSDSISELRSLARARAKTILKLLTDSGQL